MTPLLQYYQQQGFALSPQGNAVLQFETDPQVPEAIVNGCALYDQSHWGLIHLTGDDRLRYLHNQSTNQIQQLQPGQSCDTVLVNSTARTLDLATVQVLPDALWLQVSPQTKDTLLEWFDRFLFPMDKVEIADLTGQYAIFSLMGPAAQNIIESVSGEALQQFPDGGHQTLTIGGESLLCAAGNSLKLPGYTLYVPMSSAVSIWEVLQQQGTVSCGERAWESLRIRQGRPAPEHELTEDYNPLEAGLWDFISFDKGCYIGQETIARLNTYKGVKQRLFGIELSGAIENLPCKITVNGQRAGVMTSLDPDSNFGLGYVRTKLGGPGLQIQAGTVTGIVRAIPYVTHEYPDLDSP